MNSDSSNFYSAQKITLYIVEDTGDFAEMISGFFSQFFEVTSFNDPFDALTQSVLSPPDVVLTDLRRSEYSQKQIIKKIVALKKGIDVYMVSSKPNSAEMRFQHRDAGKLRKLKTVDLPGMISEILERVEPRSKSA